MTRLGCSRAVVAVLQARPNLGPLRLILVSLHIHNRGFPLVLFLDMPFVLSFGSLPNQYMSKMCLEVPILNIKEEVLKIREKGEMVVRNVLWETPCVAQSGR